MFVNIFCSETFQLMIHKLSIKDQWVLFYYFFNLSEIKDDCPLQDIDIDGKMYENDSFWKIHKWLNPNCT